MSYEEGDDESRYLDSGGHWGYGGGGGGAVASVVAVAGKGKRPVSGKGKEEEDEEDDGFDSPPARPAMRPQQQTKKPKKQVSILVEEEEEDDDMPSTTKGRKEDPFKGKQLAIPLRGSKSTGGKVVPYAVQQAVTTLLLAVEQGQIETFSKNALRELTILNGCPDEYTQVDPFVILSSSIDTGTCKIHLKEAVPYSYALMARALNATFTVQITDKIKTKPQPFAHEDVVLRPYNASQPERYNQPFACEAAVQARVDDMEEDEGVEFLLQVKAYMYSLGPLSSVDACDLANVETHVEAIKQIRVGKLKPLVDKPDKKKLLS